MERPLSTGNNLVPRETTTTDASQEQLLRGLGASMGVRNLLAAAMHGAERSIILPNQEAVDQYKSKIETIITMITELKLKGMCDIRFSNERVARYSISDAENCVTINISNTEILLLKIFDFNTLLPLLGFRISTHNNQSVYKKYGS